MQLSGIGKQLCLGRFCHVTTSDEIWAMANNSIIVGHFSGSSTNRSFNAARFYAHDWIFPCSFSHFLSDKVCCPLGGTHPPWQPPRQRGLTVLHYGCRCSGGVPLQFLSSRWDWSGRNQLPRQSEKSKAQKRTLCCAQLLKETRKMGQWQSNISEAFSCLFFSRFHCSSTRSQWTLKMLSD